jgi:hypothetical protein
MAVPTDPDTRLRGPSAASALSEAGYQISPTTLATLATRGGGPRFQKWGRYPIYEWRDLVAWAEARLSAPISSTSELDAAHWHHSAPAS